MPEVVTTAGPVLIAGAGPVGLSLATALTRHGIRVEVFEVLPTLAEEARASTLHPATLELFERWGVADEILRRGRRIDRLQYWDRRSRRLLADFSYQLIAGDTPFPFRLQCPQHRVTPVLRERVEASGLGHVHFGHELVDFTEEAGGVCAVLRTDDGLRRVRGSYLCGADGAHSAVRRRLGLRLDGLTYEDRFLLVGSDLDFGRFFPGLGPVAYICDPDEWVILMHLPRLVRTVFRLRRDEDAAAARSDAAIRARMTAFLGEAVPFRIEMRALYSVHQRVAERFAQGRILLLGDAAHLNNPTGGLGMNSGIHDAHCLAEALASVLCEGADDQLLAACAEARRSIAIDSVQRDAAANYQRLTGGGARAGRFASTDPGDAQPPDEAAGRSGAGGAAADDIQAIAADPLRAREYLLRASLLDQPWRETLRPLPAHGREATRSAAAPAAGDPR
jgi:3-(3-hydroxy-phenyl)propionate hydroxylase